MLTVFFLRGYSIVPAVLAEEILLLLILLRIILSPQAPWLEGVAVANGPDLLISNLSPIPSFLLKDTHHRQASDQRETVLPH